MRPPPTRPERKKKRRRRSRHRGAVEGAEESPFLAGGIAQKAWVGVAWEDAGEYGTRFRVSGVECPSIVRRVGRRRGEGSWRINRPVTSHIQSTVVSPHREGLWGQRFPLDVFLAASPSDSRKRARSIIPRSCAFPHYRTHDRTTPVPSRERTRGGVVF